MLLERESYKALKILYPHVPSYYRREACGFKPKSVNEPLHVPNDMFRIVHAKSRWFIRILGLDRKIIWLPFHVRASCVIDSSKIVTSQIIMRGDRAMLHLVVKQDIELNHSYSSVLGVDLGERFPATTVLLRGDGACKASPHFYGKSIRGVRRKYAYLRKRLGKKKRIKQVNRMDREQRIVSDHLHKISRSIVNEAKANNAIIVLGDLKGIQRASRGRQKTFKRIVNEMPYYRLTKYITYKANWLGIPVVTMSEYGTSRTCHFCNSEGKRVRQGLFKCPSCGHQYNADYNGAFNLAKRFFGYSLKNGAQGFVPETKPFLPELGS